MVKKTAQSDYQKILENKRHAKDLLFEMALIRFVALLGQDADHDPLVIEMRKESGGDGMSGYTKYMIAKDKLKNLYAPK